MCKRITYFGILLILTLGFGTAVAQQSPAISSFGERELWKTELVNLFGNTWYLRMTVGALANIQPGPFQPLGYTHLRLGLIWNPNFLLTPQIQVTGVTHEIGFGLRGLGDKPQWVLEVTPFILDFNINPRTKIERQTGQPTAQLEQQTQIDLKALVLARLDDLSKASEQIAKDRSIDLATVTDPLKEFKKLFEAGKVLEAAFQLNAFSMVLRAIRKMAFLTDYDETHLRTGLHRLIAALALFVEKIQRQTIKICTGLYVSEDQKKEEIISPFVNEAIKKLTFTNRQTGAKETFTLKESKCF